MKKILTALVILTHVNLLMGQECNCDAFYDWQSESTLIVYQDSLGKEPIAEFKNDQKNENFIEIRLLSQTKDFFKAEIWLAMNQEKKTGWIMKEKNIGVYARNYSGTDTLTLFVDPNINSSPQSEVHKWIPESYTVVKCKGKWLNVVLEHDSETYSGWIEPRMQCASSYTTCN